MRIRIKVDEDLCIGAASCVTIAPETFQLNVENKAIVLDVNNPSATEPVYERWVDVSEDQYQTILLGAQSCPTLAIFLYNEEGTQLFPEC
jgi:ferredoxin